MWSDDERHSIVYGLGSHGLEFIPGSMVDELIALRGSSTWGSLRASISPQRWAQILDLISRADRDVPHDEEYYDPSEVPGFDDGDWPEWPAQLALEWMPTEVASRHGQIERSAHNGYYLAVHEVDEADIVAALTAAGYDCRRDDDLVAEALGI